MQFNRGKPNRRRSGGLDSSISTEHFILPKPRNLRLCKTRKVLGEFDPLSRTSPTKAPDSSVYLDAGEKIWVGSIAARLAQETFEHVAPDDLIRCRVMLAEVERIVAPEVRS